jgi:hypothetical protein
LGPGASRDVSLPKNWVTTGGKVPPAWSDSFLLSTVVAQPDSNKNNAIPTVATGDITRTAISFRMIDFLPTRLRSVLLTHDNFSPHFILPFAPIQPSVDEIRVRADNSFRNKSIHPAPAVLNSRCRSPGTSNLKRYCQAHREQELAQTARSEMRRWYAPQRAPRTRACRR